MPRRRRRSKGRCQRAHARRRAAERFGLAYNRGDLRDVLRQIRSGDAPRLERQSLRVSLYMVRLRGVEAVAVHDRVRGEVVTFIEPRRYFRGRGRVTAIVVAGG